jgi:nitroreductase
VTTFEQIAGLMRSQATHRRLRHDPIDDDTVLAVLDLAARAPTSRPQRREFVVVRDPDVRHQLARSYRQGWSIYKRILRSRWSEDALLEDRQWESDHFEDVPVLVVTCLRGRRPLFPAIGAAAFYGAAFPAVQNLLLAAQARGLGASATTLPLWSVWEARRTLGLPRSVTPVSVVALGWPRDPAAQNPPDQNPGARGPAARGNSDTPTTPTGNVVHLDRFGHQPFRARRDPDRSSTA